MKTLRISTTAENDRAFDARPTPMLRNDDGGIGAHADYRRDDYIFPRTQSLAMRAREWESRLRPVKHWGSDIVANLAWTIFA